jgi:hypothetical protein
VGKGPTLSTVEALIAFKFFKILEFTDSTPDINASHYRGFDAIKLVSNPHPIKNLLRNHTLRRF